jgi:DNA polymerase III delta subunit
VNCGERLRKLSSEVEKLATITPRDGTVTPDIARSVLCFSSEISPKDIIEAICEGKTAAALTYMDRLQDSGDETGWILSYLRRHVLQMIRLKSSLSSGVDETIVSESLGVNPFVLKKFLMPLQGLWSMESLISSAETLSSVDEMNKTGSGLPEYLLECEVVRLSQEAMNVHVTGR